MDSPPLFQVQTPLGFEVRTSAPYWNLLQQKHPEIGGLLPGIQRCLISPVQVQRSKQDFAVYLPHGPYHLCVVAKRLNGDGFIVISYLTDAIKEGEQVWPTSA